MQTKHTQNGGSAPIESDNTPTSRFAAFFARLDWTMVFRFALIAVNVGAVIYALSKIALAYSIGGAL